MPLEKRLYDSEAYNCRIILLKGKKSNLPSCPKVLSHLILHERSQHRVYGVGLLFTTADIWLLKIIVIVLADYVPWFTISLLPLPPHEQNISAFHSVFGELENCWVDDAFLWFFSYNNTLSSEIVVPYLFWTYFSTVSFVLSFKQFYWKVTIIAGVLYSQWKE